MKQSIFLLLVMALGAMSVASAQKCSNVTGYTFYLNQQVKGAYTFPVKSTNLTVAGIAAYCAKTTRCNAFNTSGYIMTVPLVPVFSSLSTTTSCAGVYIATSRSLSGFNPPKGVNASTLRAAGNRTYLNMRAAITAASKVKATLGSGVKVSMLTQSAITSAFNASKVPLSQVSATLGNYTYNDVMAALSAPTWDSRNVNGINYISAVKDQGGCGSCVAFASVAVAEATVATVSKMTTNTNDFSEQWLFLCNGLYQPSCDTGWYAAQATDVITKVNLPYEANYPYTAGGYPSTTGPWCTLNSAPEKRAGGTFTAISFTDLTLAKAHIRQYGAVTSFFAVYMDFFNWSPSSAPYVWDTTSYLAGYHQVTVVGYDDTNSYWIVKNSWSSGWGDSGYVRISYNAGVGLMSGDWDNIYGLTWAPSSVTTSPPPPSSPPPPPPSTTSKPPPPKSPPPSPPPPPPPSPPPPRSPPPPPPPSPPPPRSPPPPPPPPPPSPPPPRSPPPPPPPSPPPPRSPPPPPPPPPPSPPPPRSPPPPPPPSPPPPRSPPPPPPPPPPSPPPPRSPPPPPPPPPPSPPPPPPPPPISSKSPPPPIWWSSNSPPPPPPISNKSPPPPFWSAFSPPPPSWWSFYSPPPPPPPPPISNKSPPPPFWSMFSPPPPWWWSYNSPPPPAFGKKSPPPNKKSPKPPPPSQPLPPDVPPPEVPPSADQSPPDYPWWYTWHQSPDVFWTDVENVKSPQEAQSSPTDKQQSSAPSTSFPSPKLGGRRALNQN
ncbi:hypothetical protein Agub_g10681 [Astrephomene gubernaculifera]|uniref:Peptidase C1A papain C-terminal domain-containing protein n=1 Tax=Astrephomene gubernaculifera TaxID=47775 RepID=A0AAD3HP85_9CHLO|nr:hypothetical protein Agub_g10681 [Astrephomene gubernaculifera]